MINIKQSKNNRKKRNLIGTTVFNSSNEVYYLM